jgi:hypothetical protein
MAFPRRKETSKPGGYASRLRASSCASSCTFLMPFFKGRCVFFLISFFSDWPIFFIRAAWPSGERERALRQASLQVLASDRQAWKSRRQTMQTRVRGLALFIATRIVQENRFATLI